MYHGQNRGKQKNVNYAKNVNFSKIRWKFINFAEIGGIYKTCGNRENYAICIIRLGGWTHLPTASCVTFGARGVGLNITILERCPQLTSVDLEQEMRD